MRVNTYILLLYSQLETRGWAVARATINSRYRTIRHRTLSVGHLRARITRRNNGNHRRDVSLVKQSIRCRDRQLFSALIIKTRYRSIILQMKKKYSRPNEMPRTHLCTWSAAKRKNNIRAAYSKLKRQSYIRVEERIIYIISVERTQAL